jgi:hypothetical protein
MNRKSRISWIIAFGALAVLITPVIGDSAQPGGVTRVSWTAVASSGPVNAREVLAPEDDWNKVRRGDKLLPLTLIRTGRRGKATLTMEQHILIVRSNSTVQLPEIGSDDVDSQVYQETGRVTYEVDGSAFDRFEVVTPYLVAGVKGTVFTVTVTDGRATVSVEEGMVEVSSRFGDSAVELHPGQEVSVDGTESDMLEIRQVENRRLDDTRQEILAARRVSGFPETGFPDTVSVEDVSGLAAGKRLYDNNPAELVINDSMGSRIGGVASGESRNDSLVERELAVEKRRTMFEVEEISKEEMEDLELRKAEIAGNPESRGNAENSGGDSGNQ